MEISEEEFKKLLAASSLGTPGAQQLIAQVPPDVARRLREAIEVEAAKQRAAEDDKE